MGVTYVGKVAVYGVDGKLAFTGVLVTDNAMTDGSITDGFDTVKFKDGIGKTKGVAATNRRYDATFTIIPYSTTLALARALVKVPSMLANVQITGFGTGTLTDKVTPLRGTWSYVGGGSVAATQNDFVKVTIPCRRWGGTPMVPTIPTQV